MTALAATACMSLAAAIGDQTPRTVMLAFDPDEMRCISLRKEIAELLPAAKACTSDSDCYHWPCSCSSLARGDASVQYIRLRQLAFEHCGEEIVYLHCLQSRPACQSGRCGIDQDLYLESISF